MSDSKALYEKLLDQEENEDYAYDLEKASPDIIVIKPLVIAPSRNKRSCWSCCCKCVLISFMLFFTLMALAVYGAYSSVAAVVGDFTVTTPHAPFPIVDLPEAEIRLIGDRVTSFADELIAGHMPREDLVVTQDELNGVLCASSDWLKGHFLLTLKEGTIQEEYSLSTDMLPGGEGRYFVGSDYTKIDTKDQRLEVQMETAASHDDWFDGPLFFAQLQYAVHSENHNLLELYLQKGSLFGQEVSQEFIDEHMDLLKDLYDDPSSRDFAALTAGIESVTVLEGKVVIAPRRNAYVPPVQPSTLEVIPPIPAMGVIPPIPAMKEIPTPGDLEVSQHDPEDEHIVGAP